MLRDVTKTALHLQPDNDVILNPHRVAWVTGLHLFANGSWIGPALAWINDGQS